MDTIFLKLKMEWNTFVKSLSFLIYRLFKKAVLIGDFVLLSATLPSSLNFTT